MSRSLPRCVLARCVQCCSQTRNTEPDLSASTAPAAWRGAPCSRRQWQARLSCSASSRWHSSGRNSKAPASADHPRGTTATGAGATAASTRAPPSFGPATARRPRTGVCTSADDPRPQVIAGGDLSDARRASERPCRAQNLSRWPRSWQVELIQNRWHACAQYPGGLIGSTFAVG